MIQKSSVLSLIVSAILVIASTVLITHSLVSKSAQEAARQELANKAVAHIIPKLHENVTQTMTTSAEELKTISSQIKKTTWLDSIQPHMERVAELYQRAITQLESHEINRSGEHFLAATYSDAQEQWDQILDSLRGSLEEEEALLYLELSQMRSDASYHLMTALQTMSAALMLEEDGFGERN